MAVRTRRTRVYAAPQGTFAAHAESDAARRRYVVQADHDGRYAALSRIFGSTAASHAAPFWIAPGSAPSCMCLGERLRRSPLSARGADARVASSRGPGRNCESATSRRTRRSPSRRKFPPGPPAGHSRDSPDVSAHAESVHACLPPPGEGRCGRSGLSMATMRRRACAVHTQPACRSDRSEIRRKLARGRATRWAGSTRWRHATQSPPLPRAVPKRQAPPGTQIS